MIMGLVKRIKLKIKKLIKQKGLSIYELAQKADLTEAYIRNWYTKRNYTPSLEAVEKICLALEVTETELVRREDEELIPATLDERNLIKSWLLLDEKQKKLILLQIDAFLNK